jgi:hypothetical protein
LRSLPLYILTEDLSFFYRINKELNKLKIPFKILNLNKINSSYHSIILTTRKEALLMEEKGSRSKILAYSDTDNFENYIIKIIAAVKIGYKDHYSEILFSVDPGKRTGLMIFLDGYYLYSYCCFKMDEVIGKITKYIQCFQSENKNDFKITFKLGNGVLELTLNLIKQIFSIYNGRKSMRIFLIDEFKSSKIKVNQKNKPHHVSKDELSALILALRDGIEIKQNEYYNLMKQYYKNRKIEVDIGGVKNEEGVYDKLALAEIVIKVIDGELTLKEASEELRLLNIKK